MRENIIFHEGVYFPYRRTRPMQKHKVGEDEGRAQPSFVAPQNQIATFPAE